MFDEEPAGDPHGECAKEIHDLQKERDFYKSQIDGLKKDISGRSAISLGLQQEVERLKEDVAHWEKQFGHASEHVGELEKQLRTAQGVINEHILDQIEGLHCVDCTAEADETCDCPMLAPIFAAMEGYQNPCVCADFVPGESPCSKCGGYAENRKAETHCYEAPGCSLPAPGKCLCWCEECKGAKKRNDVQKEGGDGPHPFKSH